MFLLVHFFEVPFQFLIDILRREIVSLTFTLFFEVSVSPSYFIAQILQLSAVFAQLFLKSSHVVLL